MKYFRMRVRHWITIKMRSNEMMEGRVPSFVVLYLTDLLLGARILESLCYEACMLSRRSSGHERAIIDVVES